MSIENAAQDHEAAEWALRNSPRPAAPTFAPGQPGYGPAECECGDDIPASRRADGCRRCTSCQAQAETRYKRTGRYR